MNDWPESWDEIVSRGIELRHRIDEAKWELGDLVNYACDRRPGRPPTERQENTLTALSKDIGENRSALSSLAANSEFYAPEVRPLIPADVSWRRCAEARRAVGWRPGQPVTPALVEEALSLLHEMPESPRRAEKTIAEQIEDILGRLRRLRERTSGGLRDALDMAIVVLEDAAANNCDAL